jgi:aryl-alcohol dehydrogenase-like predicted oxidoreductase
MQIADLKIHETGRVSFLNTELGCGTEASLSLLLVKQAWYAGVDFEDLADGFGAGLGTMGGDWSGIRDSSPEAQERMLERALRALRFDPRAVRR